MNKKQRQLSTVISVVLGIVLLGCIGILGALKWKGNDLQLNPETAVVEMVEEGTEIEVQEIVQSYSGFTIGGKSSSVALEEKDENLDDDEDLDDEDLDDEEEQEDSDYICSYSSTKKMTKADYKKIEKALKKKKMPGDRSIAQMIINEIYARNGYVFSDEGLQKYFEEKDWYNDLDWYTSDMDEITASLSKLEKNNIELLDEYR